MLGKLENPNKKPRTRKRFKAHTPPYESEILEKLTAEFVPISYEYIANLLALYPPHFPLPINLIVRSDNNQCRLDKISISILKGVKNN